MRIVTTYFEFAAEVKMIHDWWRLRDFGVPPRTSSNGAFVRLETDALREFCEHNSQYHIVSFCPDGFGWNRFHPKANAYWLAEGDSDPNLLLDWRFESEQIWEDLCENGLPLTEPGE